jgi:transglutaminase-like putative cysteine protease
MKQRLIMIPPRQDGDQQVLTHDLAIRGYEGEAEVTWIGDAFGNRVANVSVPRVPHAVDFEATFQVARDATLSSTRRPAPWRLDGRLSRYLQPTALTAPNEVLRNAAQEIFRASDDPRERAERAHNWAAGSITYQYGVTGYTTPAAMALHFEKGVCQDFAHILLALLRLLTIPCRYVSGHMLGEGAPHAWVEALIADVATPSEVEVIAYDPTHHRRTRMDYITVATGRDFADVTPTSGTYGGPALGKLASTKQAEIVELSAPAAQGVA